MKCLRVGIGIGLIAFFMTIVPALAGQTFVIHHHGQAGREGLEPRDAAEEFWTDERLQNAISLDVRLEPEQASPDYQGQDNDRTGGAWAEMKTIPAAVPTAGQPRLSPAEPSVVKNDYELDWTNCPASAYTQWYENNTTEYPKGTMGKLFVNFGGDENFVCSAAMVNRNMLLTAGQCVNHQGKWMEEAIFIPGYHLGREPFGRWAWRYVVTFTGWIEDQNYGLDVAMVLLYTNNNQSLGDIVGYMGVAYNGDPSQIILTHYGYPADAPFPGNRLVAVRSGFGEWDAHPDDNWAMGVGSNMTPGCGGGPWVIWLDGWPYAYGVSSYFYTNCAENLYSPYFGQHVIDLYNYTLAKEGNNSSDDDSVDSPWADSPDPDGPGDGPGGGPF